MSYKNMDEINKLNWMLSEDQKTFLAETIYRMKTNELRYMKTIIDYILKE
jgi:hypothetical protein